MKKTLLLITICLFTGFAVAKPVSQSAATRVANQFWQSVLHGQGQLRPTPWQYSEIYLFVGDQGGFVMVSADDCARPVIAYSLHGSLSLRALPVQLSQRMEAYCGLIAEGKNQQVSATTSDAFQWEQLTNGILPKEGENDDRVGPLLETHWHQDGGYALLTPQHTPTGCAATAQAQMMRYWRYPAFGHGNESYNCQPYGAQSADFSHTLYDWGNMPDQVSPASPYEQQLAVSTLMYHVGVSLHMGYAPGGSAAAGVVADIPTNVGLTVLLPSCVCNTPLSIVVWLPRVDTALCAMAMSTAQVKSSSILTSVGVATAMATTPSTTFALMSAQQVKLAPSTISIKATKLCSVLYRTMASMSATQCLPSPAMAATNSCSSAALTPLHCRGALAPISHGLLWIITGWNTLGR